MRTGLNETNTLKVVSGGATITLYINGAQVGQVTDPDNVRGTIGLFGADTCEVVYTNVSVAPLH